MESQECHSRCKAIALVKVVDQASQGLASVSAYAGLKAGGVRRGGQDRYGWLRAVMSTASARTTNSAYLASLTSASAKAEQNAAQQQQLEQVYAELYRLQTASRQSG